MKNNKELIDLISETFSNIKSHSDNWCDFVCQREVMKQLKTSHTQLNRYISRYPNQIKKYKMNRKVYYKKSEINDFINSWAN